MIALLVLDSDAFVVYVCLDIVPYGNVGCADAQSSMSLPVELLTNMSFSNTTVANTWCFSSLNDAAWLAVFKRFFFSMTSVFQNHMAYVLAYVWTSLACDSVRQDSGIG